MWPQRSSEKVLVEASFANLAFILDEPLARSGVVQIANWLSDHNRISNRLWKNKAFYINNSSFKSIILGVHI